MILQVFSVFDRAAMQYGHPFYAINRPVAMRSFVDAFAEGPTRRMAMHPDDFDLRHIGEFDDEAGTFKATTNETIMTGTEVVRLKLPQLPAGEDPKAIKAGGTE